MRNDVIHRNFEARLVYVWFALYGYMRGCIHGRIKVWCRGIVFPIFLLFSACAHLDGRMGVRVDRASDEFYFAQARTAVSAEQVAQFYLGDAQLAWVIADLNGSDGFSRGDKVVIPTRYPHRLMQPWGVRVTGYQTVPVLCYHKFSRVKTDDLVVSDEQFRRQLQYLKDNDFQVIPLSDLVAFVAGRRVLAPKSVVITLDDGDPSAYEVAFPILKEFGVPATLFVYTDFVGKGGVTWSLLKRMRDSGLISIESHSKTHANLVLSYNHMPAIEKQNQIVQEIRWPQKVFEQKLSFMPRQYAYPYGDVDRAILRIMDRSDYETAFTVISAGNAAFTHPYLLRRSLIYGNKPFEHFVSKLTVFENVDLSIDTSDRGLLRVSADRQDGRRFALGLDRAEPYFSAFQAKADSAYRAGDLRSTYKWLVLSKLSLDAEQSTVPARATYKGQMPRWGSGNGGFLSDQTNRQALVEQVETQLNTFQLEQARLVRRQFGEAPGGGNVKAGNRKNTHTVSSLTRKSKMALLRVLAMRHDDDSLATTVVSALREQDKVKTLRTLNEKVSKTTYRAFFIPNGGTPNGGITDASTGLPSREVEASREPQHPAHNQKTNKVVSPVRVSTRAPRSVEAKGCKVETLLFSSPSAQLSAEQIRSLHGLLVKAVNQTDAVFDDAELHQLDQFYQQVHTQNKTSNACERQKIDILRNKLAEYYYQRVIREYDSDRPMALTALKKALNYASEQQRKVFRYRNNTFLNGVHSNKKQ